MGKTRLAIELCKQMGGRGWRAGFLREDEKPGDLRESQLRDCERIQEPKAIHEMHSAVAALTLQGGARDRAEAEPIIGNEDLALLLRDLYPGRAGQRYLGGLEPDLLAEAMVWRVLSKEGAAPGPYGGRYA